MMTMAVQANGTFTCGPSFVSNNLSSLPSKTSLLTFKPKASSLHSLITSRRTQRLSAAAELAQDETMDELSDSQLAEEQFEEGDEKVRNVEKPKLVLKFVWMEKNIGLALDQEIPGYGTVPLSPYSFWPRKDAWEDLKTTLESKPWISQKKMIILLNQATDVINLWQQSGGNISS